MTNSKKFSDSQLAQEATEMALRETIMEYFKGNAIRNVAFSSAITTINLNNSVDVRHNYQRRQMEERQPYLVLLGGAPILTMAKGPSRITFYRPVLERSPQFRKLYKQLDKFLSRYLKGVKKEVSDAQSIYL